MKKNFILKVPKIKISDCIFIIMIIVYSLTASDTAGISGSIYKYMILFIGIIYSYYIYNTNPYKKDLAKKETKNLIICVIVIILYSIFKMIITVHFSFRIVQEVLFFVCPIIYAYLFVANKDYNDIRDLLKISFIITFVLYIISLGMNFNQIINALKYSNFWDSSSELESGVFSGMSFAFSIFFIYDNKSKMWKILSMLFVFMTFKRFSILIMIILFIISLSGKKNNKISKKVVLITGILCFICAFAFYRAILPINAYKIEEKYNIDMSKITTTRSDRMYALYYSNYSSYGLGSSNEYMYNNFNGALEMDFVRIFIELGYIPVIMIIYAYLYLCKDNLYLFIFMFTKIISMIITSCLTNTFSWAIIYIIIFSIKKGCKVNVSNYDNSSV